MTETKRLYKTFLFLLLFISLMLSGCSKKTDYDRITDLDSYIGTYEVMAVHHLGKNYKGISNQGRIKITETGMELVTNLDSLSHFKAQHDRANLIDISNGNFVLKEGQNKGVTVLKFDKEKSLLALSYGALNSNFTTVFVYLKED